MSLERRIYVCETCDPNCAVIVEGDEDTLQSLGSVKCPDCSTNLTEYIPNDNISEIQMHKQDYS